MGFAESARVLALGLINSAIKLIRIIKKAVDTQCSREVPHLSTNRALSHLTSEFGWDPVH